MTLGRSRPQIASIEASIQAFGSRDHAGMSKRARKVAFADEVQVEDKRRREDEAEEQAESELEDQKIISERSE